MNKFKTIFAIAALVAVGLLSGCNSGSGPTPSPAVAAAPVSQAPVTASPSTNVPTPAPQPQPPERGPIAPPVARRNPHSNAPAGYPDESPEGYAYWYPIGGDGLPIPNRDVWLWYDGRTWANTAEIEAYKVAVIQSYANRAAEDAGDASKVYNGPIEVGTLTAEEGFVLLAFARKYGPLDVFYHVCGGSAAAIRAAINQAEQNDDETIDYLGAYPSNGRLRGVLPAF
jgi:hypothetical protein